MDGRHGVAKVERVGGASLSKVIAAHVKNGRRYGTTTRHIWGNNGDNK